MRGLPSGVTPLSQPDTDSLCFSPSQRAARARRLVLRGFTQQWEALLTDEEAERRRMMQALAAASAEATRLRTRRLDSFLRLQELDPHFMAAIHAIQRWIGELRQGAYGKRRLRQELFHARLQRAKDDIVGAAKMEVKRAQDDLLRAQEWDFDEQRKREREAFEQKELDKRDELARREDARWNSMQENTRVATSDHTLLVLQSDIAEEEDQRRTYIMEEEDDELQALGDEEHMNRLITDGPCRQAVARISNWWLLCRAGIYGRAGSRRQLAFALRMAREERLVVQKRGISSYVDRLEAELLAIANPEEYDAVLARVTQSRAHRRRKLQEWEAISRSRVLQITRCLEDMAQAARGQMQSPPPATSPEPVPVSAAGSRSRRLSGCVSSGMMCIEVSRDSPAPPAPREAGGETAERALTPAPDSPERRIQDAVAEAELTESRARAALAAAASGQLVLKCCSAREPLRRSAILEQETTARARREGGLRPLRDRIHAAAPALQSVRDTVAEEARAWSALAEDAHRSARAAAARGAQRVYTAEQMERRAIEDADRGRREEAAVQRSGGRRAVRERIQRAAVLGDEADARGDIGWAEQDGRGSLLTLCRRAALRLLQRAEQMRRAESVCREQEERAAADFPAKRLETDRAVARLQARRSESEEREALLRMHATQRRGKDQQEHDRRGLLEVHEEGARETMQEQQRREHAAILVAALQRLQGEEGAERERLAAEAAGPLRTLTEEFLSGARAASAAAVGRIVRRMEDMQVAESNTRGRVCFEEDAAAWGLLEAFTEALPLTPERVRDDFQRRETTTRGALQAAEGEGRQRVAEGRDEAVFRVFRRRRLAKEAAEEEARLSLSAEEGSSRKALGAARQERAVRLARIAALRSPEAAQRLLQQLAAWLRGAEQREQKDREALLAEERGAWADLQQEQRQDAEDARRRTQLRVMANVSAGVVARTHAMLVCELCGQRFCSSTLRVHKADCKVNVERQLRRRRLSSVRLPDPPESPLPDDDDEAARQAYNTAAYEAWRRTLAPHRLWRECP